MTLLITLFFVCMIQEPFSSSAAILAVRQSGISMWYIHSVYLLATITDIVIGYWLGTHIRKFPFITKLAEKLKTKRERYSNFFKYLPRRVVLFLLSPILFPVTIILLPRLGFSFYEIFFISLLSEIVFWYIPVSILVFSLDLITPNGYRMYVAGALLILCSISLLVKTVANKILR